MCRVVSLENMDWNNGLGRSVQSTAQVAGVFVGWGLPLSAIIKRFGLTAKVVNADGDFYS